jgi:glucokinase
MDEWVIGIDLGGTKVELGLVDPHNCIVARRRIPTHDHEGPARLVTRLAQSVAELTATLSSGERIAGIGLCCPGPVDQRNGVLLDPPNIPGLHHAPLAALLTEATGLPVQLEHDAKAAGLGDFHYGAGQGESSMVYIVVGTGVGAAILHEGQLFRGLHNFAGEIGHITLDRDGERCSCGNYGCVETFLSGPRLAQRYGRLLAQEGRFAPAVLLSGEQVAALAVSGDPAAQQVLTEAGEALGAAVATLAMILSIDRYVIGGSVAKAGDLLLEPARRAVPHHAFASIAAHVQIVATALEDDGPLLGCAWLARQRGEL